VPSGIWIPTLTPMNHDWVQRALRPPMSSSGTRLTNEFPVGALQGNWPWWLSRFVPRVCAIGAG
jgi:hypothetical protein